MLIEIFPENAQKCVKNVKGNNYYYQRAYLILSTTKFPVEFELSLNDSAPANLPGRYSLSDSSFRVNQYGSLEINRFDMTLVPVVENIVSQKKTA